MHGSDTAMLCAKFPNDWTTETDVMDEPACHNRVTWLATSANLLALLAVIRIKLLCQAPLPWRHNAVSWWCHIQNIMSFQNLESDTLSDVKSTSRNWLNFVFLTSQDKNKTLYLHDTVHQTSFGESAIGADLQSARQPLTPVGMSGGPYHVTTQFYYYIDPCYHETWLLSVHARRSLTSPRVASSMMIKMGDSEQIPISLMMWGWSNCCMMSATWNIQIIKCTY